MIKLELGAIGISLVVVTITVIISAACIYYFDEEHCRKKILPLPPFSEDPPDSSQLERIEKRPHPLPAARSRGKTTTTSFQSSSTPPYFYHHDDLSFGPSLCSLGYHKKPYSLNNYRKLEIL